MIKDDLTYHRQCAKTEFMRTKGATCSEVASMYHPLAQSYLHDDREASNPSMSHSATWHSSMLLDQPAVM